MQQLVVETPLVASGWHYFKLASSSMRSRYTAWKAVLQGVMEMQ